MIGRILAILCLSVICLVPEYEARCTYAVVTPKGLRLNTPEEIYINFHSSCGGNVKVVASLMSMPKGQNRHDSTTIENFQHNRKPVAIVLKAQSASLERNVNNDPVFKSLLDIKFCFHPNCGSMQAIPAINLVLNATHGYVFMTTDRPAYRPTETVHFSLAVTDQDLKYAVENRRVKILIKTPEDQGRVTVHDSEPRPPDQEGFIEYSYTIPENPFQGVWWAEAHIDGVVMAEKSFVIEKYELPTFQVKIHCRRHFILPTQEHLEGFITAEYSYGEKVGGSYFMSFRLVREDGSEEEFHKIPSDFGRSARITNGRKPYQVPIEKLRRVLREGETLESFMDTGAKVVIMASVTGFTESVFESDVVDNIRFTRSPFIIDYSRSAKYYLKDTIYELKLTVLDAVSFAPLPNLPVKLEWTGKQEKTTFNTDKNGEIYRQIDIFKSGDKTITATTASAVFEDVDQFRVDFNVRGYQPDRKLGLRLRKQVADVGDVQHVEFDLGASTPPDIRFFVISRGRFVHTDTKYLNNQRGQVSANFEVTAEMVPNARVVAYYILGNKMTSNSAWFDVTNECKTELVIKPDRDEVLPGSPVSFTVKGAPADTFYFSAIDRAAYFVHNGTRVSRDQLWSKMEQYDTGCSRKGGLDAVNVFEEAGLIINSLVTPRRNYRSMYCAHSRRKRSVVSDPEAVLQQELEKCENDGYRLRPFSTCDEREARIRKNLADQQKDDAFIDKCIRKFDSSCKSRRSKSGMARAAVAAQDKANQVRRQVRRDFSENMVFSRRRIPPNGVVKISTKAKDSITVWELDAFGMGKNSPMCVAETKQMRVFMKFFVQLYLPYSLRVREQATIRFSVFNYGDDEDSVRVFIRLSEELCSRFRAGVFTELGRIRVRGHSATASTFTVLPLRIPEGKHAKIEIKLGEGDDERDHIEKLLLIEEPGVHNESSKTIVLQPKENGQPSVKDLEFDIPKRSVMLSTQRCEIFAYAHPMGPSIEIDPFNGRLGNMNGLIRQPTGCGEQNMIIIGPIVYIHTYRIAAYGDRVTVAQKNQVVAHIQSAYSIELKWRSEKVNKRAFAVWNTSPPSTWLNAFVIKVFSAAREFWPGMGSQHLCTALDWLLTQQTGAIFKEHYRVHHREMIGQVDDDISLTAYVTISLVEATHTCSGSLQRLQAAVNRAKDYLIAETNTVKRRPYTLAMGAYALAISDAGSNSARDWNRMLRDTKEHDGEYIYWRGTRGRAANIETTAYALLAELALNGISDENDELTRNVAHWLISQRNEKGGFVSTQDTVVALQALSVYMATLENSVTHGPPATNLRVRISSADRECKWNEIPRELTLTKEDSMKRRKIDVPPSAIAGGVKVTVLGIGTGSLSYRCTWRQHNDDGNCHFQVQVSVHHHRGGDPKKKTIKVVVQKVRGPPAQISIIDVGILSGYKPDEDSIKQLCIDNVVDAAADRYEITENVVKFYLNSIDADGVKLAFNIDEVAPVKNRQHSSVSAYDYYEPEIRCTKFYTLHGDHKIRSTCAEAERGEDEQMCKCAEGDCPICRTRQQQLEETVCSNHPQTRRKCGKLCKIGQEACYNLHTVTCRSDYAYIVTVLEVGVDETPFFKYFRARVDEVIRMTAQHIDPLGSVVKFLMRDDCFSKCKDERFIQIAQDKTAKTGQHHEPQHYLGVNRTLLVYGNNPRKDLSTDPPTYVYDLVASNGVEIMMAQDKCVRLKKKKPNNPKLDICTLKSALRASHLSGCD